MKTKLTFVIGILLVCAANALAQGGGKAEPNRVNFAKGNKSAKVSGTLSNNQQMEYFSARKPGRRLR